MRVATHSSRRTFRFIDSTRSPREYGERNKTSHGGNERHPYAHRREPEQGPGGAVSRFSRIMVFVRPSVACARRSWIPCGRHQICEATGRRSPEQIDRYTLLILLATWSACSML